MCAQFQDHREWVREYVANSYDAGAEDVLIGAKKKGEDLTIFVQDDGHGMDCERVVDFFTLYRSRKGTRGDRSIGRHGVGKLSVAAIPDQHGFRMRTSTGAEAWLVETGCLLEDVPITIKRLDRIPPRGTGFEITFKSDQSPEEELDALRKILERYMGYLPIRIFFEAGENQWEPLLTREWTAPESAWGQYIRFTLEGKAYEAVLNLGPTGQEVYQNRVFVTDRDSLLTGDLSSPFVIPHVQVRIDSPAFELPFGRHGLVNEEGLGPIAKYLREEVLKPLLFGLCRARLTANDWSKRALPEFEVDEIVVTLLRHAESAFGHLRSIPVFREVHGLKRHSLEDVERIVTASKALYLDDGSTRAPALAGHWAPYALKTVPSAYCPTSHRRRATVCCCWTRSRSRAVRFRPTTRRKAKKRTGCPKESTSSERPMIGSSDSTSIDALQRDRQTAPAEV